MKAPPILGPLDFLGLQNSIILIEGSDDENLILKFSSCIEGSILLISSESQESEWDSFLCDDISKSAKAIKATSGLIDWYVIHRIDLFNLDQSKKIRGANIKGQLSILSPKILQKSNIIITSCNQEYMLRELCDVYINLRFSRD